MPSQTRSSESDVASQLRELCDYIKASVALSGVALQAIAEISPEGRAQVDEALEAEIEQASGSPAVRKLLEGVRANLLDAESRRIVALEQALVRAADALERRRASADS